MFISFCKYTEFCEIPFATARAGMSLFTTAPAAIWGISLHRLSGAKAGWSPVIV